MAPNFTLEISAPTHIHAHGYLFLCTEENFQTGPNSFRWSDHPGYWPLDPSGSECLSMDEATLLGFLTIELLTEDEGRSWDHSLYAGLRQFHQAKGLIRIAGTLGKPLHQSTYERTKMQLTNVRKELPAATRTTRRWRGSQLSPTWSAQGPSKRVRILQRRLRDHFLCYLLHEKPGHSLADISKSERQSDLGTVRMPHQMRDTVANRDVEQRLDCSDQIPLPRGIDALQRRCWDPKCSPNKTS